MRCCCSTTRTRPPSTPGPKEVETALAPHGVKIVHRLALDLSSTRTASAASISASPTACRSRFRSATERRTDDTRRPQRRPARTRDPWHGVPLGEILLGHTNAHHEKAPGPWCRTTSCRARSELTPDGAPEGFLNFGLTAATWWCASSGSTSPRSGNPSKTTPRGSAPTIRPRRTSPPTGSPNGSSAATSTAICCARRRAAAAGRYNQPQNAFGFAEPIPMATAARSARMCAVPIRATASRKDLASAQTLLDAANNHRILRRGRKYGATVTDRHTDDGAERGLLFICLNADIARQFEFVQQTWLLNKNFATLVRRDRSAGRSQGPLHHPRAAVAPDRRGRDLHPVWPAASISSCRAFRPCATCQALETDLGSTRPDAVLEAILWLIEADLRRTKSWLGNRSVLCHSLENGLHHCRLWRFED